MKKIAIIGGGVSGLTARYHLSKQFPDAEITLYEKSEQLGGCVQTLTSPYFFEIGPRTIKASRSGELLKLIDILGLQDQVIYSSKEANTRYLWVDQKLRSLPSLLPRLIPALLKEWKQPPSHEENESIASFATRRFGKKVAETFFDPITLGIFAGDIHHLSITSCFPGLKEMERTYGSLTHAFLKRKKEKKPKGLLSLQGGLTTLIQTLADKGRGKIHLSTAIDTFPSGETILAVPPQVARTFFKGDQIAEAFFDSIHSVPLTVINFAFQEKDLTPKGFGYLVPSKEQEKVLGVVFDSSIFPSQNQKQETRLTVMLRNGGEKEALDALRRHLRIEAKPVFIHTTTYSHAVPQYGVRHLKRVSAFEKYLKEKYPHVTCIGNYLRGASLNACIFAALKRKHTSTPMSYNR